jgi:hypothetical protein
VIVHFPLPDYVLDDLIKFISEKHPKNVPHSLIVAQAFCLKYPDYGKKYGLSRISDAVEVIKRDLY